MKTYKTQSKVFSLKVETTDFKQVKIQSQADAEAYARNFYFDDIEIYESFFIILLNRQGNTIGYAKISQGGVAGTYVDTALIAKYAIESLASSVILVHNHPSGNLKASESDIKMTKKVIEGLKLFEISVLDHIIITKESSFSINEVL